MLACLWRRVRNTGHAALHAPRRRLAAVTKPSSPVFLTGSLADLLRSEPELIGGNALLRQQRVILRRCIAWPRRTPTDRALPVVLASRVRAWRLALVIVRPDTLLRWHREPFRLCCRWTSRPGPVERRLKVLVETIALIRELAATNRLWAAARIRGELLRLDIRVAKWTVQKYMRDARRNGRARVGRRSCATTPARPGPATSSRSRTPCSVPCTRSS